MTNRGNGLFTLLTIFAAAGCAPERAPEPTHATTEADTVRARFDDQGILILPFDHANSACAADPIVMDRETFAACTHLDAAKLDPAMRITKDPIDFDPEPEKKTILVLKSRDGWQALLGLGRLSSQGSSLVHTSGAGNLRPLCVPACAVPLVIAAEPLVQAGMTALIGVGVAYFGGKAVVATGQAIRDRQSATPIVNDSQRLIMMSSSLQELKTQAQEQIKDKLRSSPDNGWISAAACVDGRSTSRRPEWGYGPTAEEAEKQALDNASNMMNVSDSPAQWDDETYCRVLWTCQKTGSSLSNCR